MQVNPGEAVTITAQSSNPGDPPVSVQWKPPTGKVNLTVTVTNAAGDEEDHTFHLNVKGGN